MRGHITSQPSMLALLNPESLVPPSHPIRGIKALADAALLAMRPALDAMYAQRGRPSVPPEQLLKSQLLIALYTVRSERLFCEQLAYNLLYRWFLDMDMEGGTFDPSTFSHNRDRLLEHEVGQLFFDTVVRQADLAGLVSSEHFSVDGTLIEAWASLKSFKRKDGTSTRPSDDDKGNPSVDFHGEKRSNETHESSTDPEARLARKSNGTTAKLSYMGHGLMENRNGLLVGIDATQATGTAEREAALSMVMRCSPGEHRITLGADKGYDTADFIADTRAMNVTPHIAANTGRRGGPAVDGRTTRQPGYEVSQRVRKRIEEIWGWAKTVGGVRKTRFKGLARVRLHLQFTGAAYNLVRMVKLMATP